MDHDQGRLSGRYSVTQAGVRMTSVVYACLFFPVILTIAAYLEA